MGMWGWGKGLEWGFLRLPLLTWSLGYSSSFISSTCDKNSSIERHKLSPSPRIACQWGTVVAIFDVSLFHRHCSA